MKLLSSRRIWLWPFADRYLLLVSASDTRFHIMPALGFCERDGRTYFVFVFGRLYVGMRIIPDDL